MVRKMLILAFSALLLTSCGGTDPVFDLVPAIHFVDILPKTVQQDAPDAISLTLHYQDGDGDLGVLTDADNNENLYVRDTRENIPDEARLFKYTIPNLTPDTKNPSIQGEITITLTAPVLSKFYPPFSGPNEEEVVFEIYLYDRAGNQSNVIQTTPITITQ